MQTPFHPLTKALALVALCGSCGWLLASPAAHAARGLHEPPSIGRLVTNAPRADVDKALADAGIADRCAAALKATDLRGVECRAAVAAVLVRSKPVEAPGALKARTALFADLTRAAATVSAWTPLTPPPGLSRARFDAHSAISRALMSVYDDLVSGRDRAPAIDTWLRGSAAPKSAACKIAQRSVELSAGGDASLAERGAAQSLLTSHGCFLDESRLTLTQPKPGALRGSTDAASLAAATSSEAAILAYAQTRSFDIERCQKHLDVAGKPKDPAKLEECACGAVARWKLPAPKAPTSTQIPVSERVTVALDVDPAGGVARCGPVSVAARAP